MNAYEQRKAERIERQRERAANLRGQADAASKSIRAKLDCMNGTPILVGHHSQRRHERDLARIDSAMRKSIDASKEADRLERAADAAEVSTAVSSDDPDAIAKLREQLAEAKERHARLLDANDCFRKGNPAGGVEFLAMAWGIDVMDAVARFDIWRSMGHKTVPTANSSADIRRIEKRIAELEAKQSRPAPPPLVVGDVTVTEEENRLRIRFPDKPAPEVRDLLKAHGFRFSPREGAWQRMPSPDAWYWAKKIAGASSGAI